MPHAVYARAHRILREREAARDVTQEVFVRCFGFVGVTRCIDGDSLAHAAGRSTEIRRVANC